MGPVVIVQLGCALSRDDWKTVGPVVIVQLGCGLSRDD